MGDMADKRRASRSEVEKDQHWTRRGKRPRTNSKRYDRTPRCRLSRPQKATRDKAVEITDEAMAHMPNNDLLNQKHSTNRG